MGRELNSLMRDSKLEGLFQVVGAANTKLRRVILAGCVGELVRH